MLHRSRGLITLAVALILTVLLSTPASAASIIFVDANVGGGANNGSSWGNAYTTLQDALNNATSGDQIWVADGLYYPDEGTGQSNNAQGSTFQLISGVAIYGGFAGGEGALNQRNPATNLTILSGDIDQNDLVGLDGLISSVSGIQGSNAYHVVTANGTNASTTLDGVIITAGDASLSTSNEDGGGIYNDGGSLTLTNVRLQANRALNEGGGMWNQSSNPTLNDVTFKRNQAAMGGGMFNTVSDPQLTGGIFELNVATTGGGMWNGGGSDPNLSGVHFVNNAAQNGGGIYNVGSSNVILNNVHFEQNSALDMGGAMRVLLSSGTQLTNVTFVDNTASNAGGGMAITNGSTGTITNATFDSNDATEFASVGGGIFTQNNSNFVLTNVTFSGNTADFRGGGMHNDNSDPQLTNVLFFGNTAALSAGGGLSNDNGSDPTITNATFAGNFATTNGGAVANEDSQPTIQNSVFWGNSGPGYNEMVSLNVGPTVTYTLIDSAQVSGPWSNGAGNITDGTDPLLANATTGDLRLLPISPAVNAGSNGLVPGGVTTDPDGAPRIQDVTVDMGGYETNLAPFADVPADLPAPFMEDWVETYLAIGLTSGKGQCEDGSTPGPGELLFCPADPVTRGEMAVFILRAMEYPNLPYDPPGDPSDPFADVFAGSPALPAPFMEDFIEEFFARQITGGKTNCTNTADAGQGETVFCPKDLVTRGEMAVFILRALEYPNTSYQPPNDPSDPLADVFAGSPALPAPFMEAWIEEFLTRGITNGKLNCTNSADAGVGELVYCPADNVTRAEMAVFILRAFDAIPDPED